MSAERGGAAGSSVQRFILLSDIAGSSRLAESFPAEYQQTLARHNALIESRVANHRGEIYKFTGDGYYALFESAADLGRCALSLARELASFEPLPGGSPFRVRLALHGGELLVSGAEYLGTALNRVSRICQVCNPGQSLCSGKVAAALALSSSSELRLTNLGLHHLRDLDEPEQLFQFESSEAEHRQFPALATLNNRPNNLLVQPNSFVGREKELSELGALLRGGKRLISIIAPGGYGKSRLAAQLCANLLPHFERGVFMIYLSPVRDVLDVPQAIASELNCQFTPGRLQEQQLCEFLRNKTMLLSLDNLEHLLACSSLIAAILRAAPGVKIVCTSREPLRIEGEDIYRLDPLSVESSEADTSSEAVRLFADRAALVNKRFVLGSATLPSVESICQRLNGIPLAIELAAAWMDSFTAAELQQELAGQLELEARSSDLPARHQSLKACLDWSWNLLGEPQQETLMRFSVFRGGFFSDAASEVLGIRGMPLRGVLGKLCDKSWLYTREVEGQTRYYLRDMLAHEYALARLAEHSGSGVTLSHGPEDSAAPIPIHQSARQAHSDYFADFAAREGPALSGAGSADNGAAQRRALRIWRIELENISAALETGLQFGQLRRLEAIIKYLQRYLDVSSSYTRMHELYRPLQQAALSEGSGRSLALSCLGLGLALFRLSRPFEAQNILETAIHSARALGDQPTEAAALAQLASVLAVQGSFSQAESLFLEAIGIQRAASDQNGAAASLGNLANILDQRGQHAQAAELYLESLSIFRQLGDLRRESAVLSNLAQAQCSLGDLQSAEQLQEQALAIKRAIGDRGGESNCLGNLANVALARGNLVRASRLNLESLAIKQEIGNRFGEADALGNLAGILTLQGELIRAVQVHSQALAIRAELGDQAGVIYSCAFAAALLAQLGQFENGAISLSGALLAAERIGYAVDPQELPLLEKAEASLAQEVASGRIGAAQLVSWKARGQGMGPDELAEFTLSALHAAFQDPAIQNAGPAEA